jgi:hypothetical protein
MRCANCGRDVNDRYCGTCGQPCRAPDLSVGGFLRETTQELTSWDGKIPATLRALLLRPGQLTLDFLQGRRARWLPPLRVYLICSIAFFASKPVIEALTGRSPRELARVTLHDRGTGPRQLTPEDRQAIAEGLPGRLFGVDRLERAATDSRRLNAEIDRAFPRAMFLLLPIFALLTRVAWGHARPQFPAHLYVALHVHAAVFAALTAFAAAAGFVPSDAVAALAFLAFAGYVLWYVPTALHRVFGERWGRTLLKSALVGAAYVACLLIVSLTLLLYAITRV